MKNSKTLFDDIPLGVGELTSMIKTVVEKTFLQVYVVGEISSLTRQRSGHCYLTLKDSEAQLPTVIWNSTASRIKFDLHNGMEVLCRGRLEVYAPYGKYQFIVTKVEPKGVGALELAFRQLHTKLSSEGLFLPERKKAIPQTIHRVAVITSATGAAIRDFLNVAGRRTKRLDAVIVPVNVQGEGASAEIRTAFERVNKYWTADRPDCIVLIRGGGSQEDLWTFNEEETVRALAASSIPVVTGIGHEIDVSLCDLAADLHALTPTDAALRIVPDDTELERGLNQLEKRLHSNLELQLERAETHLNRLKFHPLFVEPENRILEPRREILDRICSQCERLVDLQLERNETRLAGIAARLESLSPLSVLGRGFSLTKKENGQLIRSSDEVSPGDTIITRLAQGQLVSSVTSTQ